MRGMGRAWRSMPSSTTPSYDFAHDESRHPPSCTRIATSSSPRSLAKRAVAAPTGARYGRSQWSSPCWPSGRRLGRSPRELCSRSWHDCHTWTCHRMERRMSLHPPIRSTDRSPLRCGRSDDDATSSIIRRPQAGLSLTRHVVIILSTCSPATPSEAPSIDRGRRQPWVSAS